MNASTRTNYSNTTTVSTNNLLDLEEAISANVRAVVALRKRIPLDTVTITFDVKAAKPKPKYPLDNDFWCKVATGEYKF